jgi:hypothetical protein
LGIWWAKNLKSQVVEMCMFRMPKPNKQDWCLPFFGIGYNLGMITIRHPRSGNTATFTSAGLGWVRVEVAGMRELVTRRKAVLILRMLRGMH